ncbi:hypothetical protein TD95_002360 [Thielaviopsis punctulata]|uniref:Rhodanese domain-containing protein n=1 Tax=Thielaviopsis punctulata TaxID=72032 RepID=A0A0F4ZCY2_9PEZI|nr:hypothetical protein TD95_002360 [Thielaviopsis punctulata]
MATIASLKRISAKDLAAMILARSGKPEEAPFAVVDRQQQDRIGGHIKNSIHVPSHTVEAMLPTLLRRFQDKEAVIFHCALSQQRGPSAALKYLRSLELERERTGQTEGQVKQEVMVLDRGFVGWQELYGEEERLTESYNRELWQGGW